MAWWDKRYNALQGKDVTAIPNNAGGTTNTVNVDNQWWGERYKVLQAEEDARIKATPVTVTQPQPTVEISKPAEAPQSKLNPLQAVQNFISNLLGGSKQVKEPEVQVPKTTEPSVQPSKELMEDQTKETGMSFKPSPNQQKNFIRFLFEPLPEEYKAKNLGEVISPVSQFKRGIAGARATLQKPEYANVLKGMAGVQEQMSIDKQIENIQGVLQKSADKDVASEYNFEKRMKEIEPKPGIVDSIELEKYRVAIFNEIAQHPASYMEQVKKTIEPIMTDNFLMSRLSKTTSDFFLGLAGGSKKVDEMWKTKLKEPVTWEEKALATAGDVVGNVISLIGAGSILKGIGLARVSSPLIFEAMGQQSLPEGTKTQERLLKAPLYALTGFLISKVGVPEKFLSKELATGSLKVGGLLGGQTFIDYLTRGLSPKDAAELSAKAGLVGILYHVGFSAARVAITPKVGAVKGVEFTPQELRDHIVGSKYENSEFGKYLIKTSIEAETQGKNISIDASALGKSPLAKVTGWKVPSGLTANVRLIDPSAQLKPSETAITPKSQVIENAQTPVSIPVTAPPATPMLTKEIVSKFPVVLTKDANKFVNSKDFADSIEGSEPEDWVGVLDPKTIIARDPIDRIKVNKMVEDIKSGNAEKMPPIIIERTDTGQLQTFDGSNRVTSYAEANQPVTVIYHGGDLIPGLIKIEDLYKLLNEKSVVQKGIKPQEIKKPVTVGVVEPKTQELRGDKGKEVPEHIKICFDLDATLDTLLENAMEAKP
jgi:hypothetical protein